MKYFLITIITIMTLVGCGGAEERKEVYLEKAKLSLEAGDLDKARIELKNVLQIDPKDAHAYFQMGEILNQKYEYKKAFVNYSKAVELAPDNFEYHARLGTYFLILANDIDRAIEERDFILGKDESDINGLLLKAGILYKQNDIANAKKITQDIFLSQPGFVHNALFLSTLYVREKKYEDAINTLNKCIKENPENRFLISSLAKTYFESGKYDLAENAYRAIMNKNPEVYSNHLKLAMFYKEIGKSQQAENVLRKAMEENSNDENRIITLVELVKQTKGNQIAIDELKSLIANNENMGELRLIMAKLQLTEKNHDEAEKTLKLAASDFSNSSVGMKAKVYLANIYMQKNNIDAAINVIDDAFKMSPNDSEINFIKAKLQLLQKKYEEAITSLRIVVKDDPEKIDAYLLLYNAHRANGEEEQAAKIINKAYENNRSNIKGLVQLATHYVKNNNPVQAEKIADHCLSLDASDYEALSLKSTLLNGKKVYPEAESYASRLLELYPSLPNGYIQSVPYLLKENRKSEAISLLEEGNKKVSEKQSLLVILVSLYNSLNNFDEAENQIQYTLRENGETAALYTLLADVQIKSGNLDAAKTSLKKAIDIKSYWNEPYLILANLYKADNQSEKAVEILQQGLVEIKSDLKLTHSLTNIFENQGKFELAISEYEKALEDHHDNIVIENNLAMLLAVHRSDKNSLKRAKELADKLKSSNRPVILDTVGWVYYKIGDYTEAVSVLKVVVEKSPNVAVFNYHLGMALYNAGDEVTAKTYLIQSLANNNSFPGKDEVERLLKKLQ